MNNINNSPTTTFIQFLTGPLAGKTIPITKSSITLGREPTNDIVINDAGVSRSHARLIQTDTAWRIEKLTPQNTVTVNQQNIEQRVIDNNDTISLGTSTTFCFINSTLIASTVFPGAFPALATPPPYAPPSMPQGAMQQPPARQGNPPLFQPQRSEVPYPPKPQSGFSRRAILISLVGLGGVAVVGCGLLSLLRSAPSSSSSTSSSSNVSDPQPGYISGTTIDTQGHPLPNAMIYIGGAATNGQDKAYSPQTDANGQYSIQVADGSYIISATIQKMYESYQWNLQLHPTDNIQGSQDSQNGIIKNFEWKLTGLKPGGDPNETSSYYGASVTVYPQSQFPDGSTFQFTLTPKGTLVDGSTGNVLIFKRTIAELLNNSGPIDHTFKLYNIPLGEYTLTGTVTEPDGTMLPVTLGEGVSNNNPSQSFDVQFKAGSGTYGGIMGLELAVTLPTQ